jgi:hypothetical protein
VLLVVLVVVVLVMAVLPAVVRGSAAETLSVQL